jgi:hypothetical protein
MLGLYVRNIFLIYGESHSGPQQAFPVLDLRLFRLQGRSAEADLANNEDPCETPPRRPEI